MVYRPKLDERSCFVMLPLRQPFLGYFEQIIRPAVAELGLVAEKADDVYGTRPVIEDIWEQIWRARIAIAIVTGKNPNVNYELGICHTLGIPTILLTEKEQDVPFDYRHRRYLSYKVKNAGWEPKLREDIKGTIKAIIDRQEDEVLPWPYDINKLMQTSISESPFDDEVSRQMVMKGVELSLAVTASAFGPDGRGISQQNQFGRPSFLRSGAQILQTVTSRNPYQMQGIEAIRQLGHDMQTREGDLTKTAVLLGASMIKAGDSALQRGVPPKQLFVGMEQAADAASASILSLAKPLGQEDLERVALTASRDKEIAMLVANAFIKAGEDGLIHVEERAAEECGLEFWEGLHFDNGYISREFVMDVERDEIVLQDAMVLIYEPKIESMIQLLPLLEKVARDQRPLLIISSDVTGEALATLTLNQKKGTIKCVAVKAPGMGDRRKEILRDIAAVTGGTPFFQTDYAPPLNSIEKSSLGSANWVTVNRSSTTIVGNTENLSRVQQRINEIRFGIANSSSDYDRAHLRERLAKLTSGIATILIGGQTESARSEKKYAANSAVSACWTAKERGVVAGGGASLLAARRFARKIVVKGPSESEGAQIVLDALLEPMKRILDNAKKSDAGLLKQVTESESDTLGFDTDAAAITDMVAAGILDSARALESSIRLAFAHAKSYLSLGAWLESTAVEAAETSGLEVRFKGDRS